VAYDPAPRNTTGNYLAVHYGAGFWLDEDGNRIPEEDSGRYASFETTFVSKGSVDSTSSYAGVEARGFPTPFGNAYLRAVDIDSSGTSIWGNILAGPHETYRTLQPVELATGPTTEAALYYFFSTDPHILYLAWKPHRDWWPWAD
jgi:hypothetical protein